jgi:competence protein ComGC
LPASGGKIKTMRKSSHRKNRGSFLSLIEFLIVLAIISFLAYKILNGYLKPALNKENQKSLSETGINTANYKTIIDTTRDKMRDIQKQEMKRIQEIEDVR